MEFPRKKILIQLMLYLVFLMFSLYALIIKILEIDWFIWVILGLMLLLIGGMIIISKANILENTYKESIFQTKLDKVLQYVFIVLFLVLIIVLSNPSEEGLIGNNYLLVSWISFAFLITTSFIGIGAKFYLLFKTKVKSKQND